MIAQEELDRVVADGMRKLWPQFAGKIATIGARSNFRNLLINHVSRKIEDPFSIQINDQGTGGWSVVAVPLPTAAEIEARERAVAEAIEASRLAQIESDKHRGATHATRAGVHRDGDQAFVSIDGMIEDLKHWRVPPELWNEEGSGFLRALTDVRRYLETRRRRG